MKNYDLYDIGSESEIKMLDDLALLAKCCSLVLLAEYLEGVATSLMED